MKPEVFIYRQHRGKIHTVMLIGGGGGSGGGINASNVATSGGRIGSGPLCGNTGNVLGGNGGTATNNVSNWQNVSANDCKCGSGGRGGRS